MSKRDCSRRLWLNQADNATNVLPKLRVIKATLLAIVLGLQDNGKKRTIAEEFNVKTYYSRKDPVSSISWEGKANLTEI